MNKPKNLTLWQHDNDTESIFDKELHLRSIETDAAELEDKAIAVADRAMESEDLRLALDAAKSVMNWSGKGSKGKTTIIAENAQINQIDTKDREHILEGLKDVIKLTSGVKNNENHN